MFLILFLLSHSLLCLAASLNGTNDSVSNPEGPQLSEDQAEDAPLELKIVDPILFGANRGKGRKEYSMKKESSIKRALILGRFEGRSSFPSFSADKTAFALQAQVSVSPPSSASIPAISIHLVFTDEHGYVIATANSEIKSERSDSKSSKKKGTHKTDWTIGGRKFRMTFPYDVQSAFESWEAWLSYSSESDSFTISLSSGDKDQHSDSSFYVNDVECVRVIQEAPRAIDGLTARFEVTRTSDGEISALRVAALNRRTSTAFFYLSARQDGRSFVRTTREVRGLWELTFFEDVPKLFPTSMIDPSILEPPVSDWVSSATVKASKVTLVVARYLAADSYQAVWLISATGEVVLYAEGLFEEARMVSSLPVNTSFRAEVSGGRESGALRRTKKEAPLTIEATFLEGRVILSYQPYVEIIAPGDEVRHNKAGGLLLTSSRNFNIAEDIVLKWAYVEDLAAIVLQVVDASNPYEVHTPLYAAAIL